MKFTSLANIFKAQELNDTNPIYYWVSLNPQQCRDYFERLKEKAYGEKKFLKTALKTLIKYLNIYKDKPYMETQIENGKQRYKQ